MNMISIQRILGREDKFYTLLEQSAEEARSSARVLVKYLQDPFQLKNLTEFIHSRRKEKAIATQISDELCTTFITSLEREDIEALSTSIYKIPKTVEKIAERIMLAPHFLKSINLARQMALMIRVTDTLYAMVEGLRTGLHLERIHELNEELQAIEGEADKALLELLQELYTVNTEAIRAVFLKDILELMEKVFDRCRDAGNVINHIVLKNS
jgi:uncharacterized protein